MASTFSQCCTAVWGPVGEPKPLPEKKKKEGIAEEGNMGADDASLIPPGTSFFESGLFICLHNRKCQGNFRHICTLGLALRLIRLGSMI